MSENSQAGSAPAQNAGNQSMEQQVENLTAGNLESKEAAPVAPPTPEVKAKLKQLKYKANGNEYTEDLPFEIDDNPQAVEYLTKQFSLARAAQAAMQENSSTKKQVEQVMKALKGDTAMVLQELGIDPKEFAAKIIEEEIKKSQMTPEQLELEELRASKKQLEEEREREKEERKKEARSKEEQLAYEKISNEIAEAIKTTYLPKEPATVRRVAHYLRVANEAGIEVSAKDVMPFVEQDLKAELQSILNQLGEDNIEDFVGKDHFARIRKKNIAKAKSAPTTPATAKADIKEVRAQPKSDKPVEKKSFKDFFGV